MFKAATIVLMLCATMMSGCIDDIQKDIVDTAIEQATEDVMFGITFDADPRSNPHEFQVAINDGGTAVIRTDGEIVFGNWEIYREAGSGDMYDVVYGDTELQIMLKTNGIAVGNLYENDFAKCGEPFYGEWQANPFSSSTADDTTDDDSSSIISDIVDSVTTGSDRLDTLPITVMITTRTTHVSDLRRVIIMEDGTMELCGHPECFDGTWELHSKTKTSRTYYIYAVDRWTEEIYCTDITIYNDGTAKYEFVGGDRVYYGTWELGIDRTQGAGALIETVTEKATVTEDRNDRDSDGTPLTADIKGALPTDYIRYILESDGTVEQCSRGECIYGTWELVSQTGSGKTYDFDLEHECSLTTFNDGSAELDVTGVSFTFKGTWASGIIT